MTNMPKMSRRAADALTVLADGGCFRYGLETNSYTRREQFQWRLKAANRSVVPGVGGAAYRELVKLGFAFCSEAQGFTGIATEYRLKVGA